MSQKVPVSRKLAELTSTPVSPASPAMPERALSNLFTSSIWRTPRSRTSSICSEMAASSQAGTSPTPGTFLKVQPKGTEVSMPRTTAIFPWLMTLRAS